MTTIQRQGRSECCLATIAMLANKPLDLIRRRACNAAGVTHWYEAAELSPEKFWKGVAHVVRFYNLGHMVTTAGQVPTGDRRANRRLVLPTAPKLIGRGQVIFDYAEGGAHSVAVDNGVVFDSNQTAPMKLQEYWTKIVIDQAKATWFTTMMDIGE